MQGPDITILIPVRNGEDFIGEAIESVLAQTFTRWTLTVRDNRSTDGTRQVVARYLSDPRIRLIQSDADLNMAGNFNRCLDTVQTAYYMLLCHDDYLYTPSAIEEAYKVMEAQPSVPAVYCDLMFVNADRSALAARRFRRSGLTESLTLARNSILRARNLFGIPLLARTSSLGSFRYDDSLPYVIDLDLSIRTALGQFVYHIPKPLIANRYHGKNRTGLLLRGVPEQLIALAQRYCIRLSAFDQFRIKLAAFHMSVAKQAFIFYAGRIQPRLRSGAANARTA